MVQFAILSYPTIIAVAVEAYSTHNLSEIAHSKAGQDDINLCEAKLDEIDYAKSNNKKCLCFVTGVPGAGKNTKNVVAVILDSCY